MRAVRRYQVPSAKPSSARSMRSGDSAPPPAQAARGAVVMSGGGHTRLPSARHASTPPKRSTAHSDLLTPSHAFSRLLTPLHPRSDPPPTRLQTPRGAASSSPAPPPATSAAAADGELELESVQRHQREAELLADQPVVPGVGVARIANHRVPVEGGVLAYLVAATGLDQPQLDQAQVRRAREHLEGCAGAHALGPPPKGVAASAGARAHRLRPRAARLAEPAPQHRQITLRRGRRAQATLQLGSTARALREEYTARRLSIQAVHRVNVRAEHAAEERGEAVIGALDRIVDAHARRLRAGQPARLLVDYLHAGACGHAHISPSPHLELSLVRAAAAHLRS
eukprot:CAMPEP_0119398296 /NCGR_PEP_ID=MMETSP1334-20130426/140773_1 /TAXON_ID=127549 /ORGANISM="Calcidiscus leptoporus, Strain RCC1130" /LENGTH=339 /DNA_ID=CAMNT_0007422155 /DNA_START=242 /DNA_END=1259 /DNA_ORIENTATION=-